MPDQPSDPTLPAHEAPFEDVLVAALDLLEREGAPGIERLLASYPAHATRLRSHLSRLHHLGLLSSDAAAAAAPSFPERLGDFRLERRLGGGGMGVVYLAEQLSLGRRVALKLVRSEHLYFPGARERFRREVDAVAKLQHPGIVPVHAAGEDGGVPWLAMELVAGASLDVVLQQLDGRDPATLRGSDLRDALQRAMALAPDPVAAGASPSSEPIALWHGTWSSACLRIARSVAIALQHAHERGVLHRDVKPSNVMLTPDGRTLLLDFGLAVTRDDPRLTGSHGQLGTPAYMSPEQMRGDTRAIDARTDVYSLGVTLYELLTLRMPFAAESTAAIRDLVLAGRLPPLRQHNRAVSHDLEVVCRKACDIDRERRYGDAAALAADLGNLLELRPIQAQPPSALLTARRWAQRHPAFAVALVAGVLVFLVAPTVFLLQQQAANREIRDALNDANQQRIAADLARDAAQEQQRQAVAAAKLAQKQRNIASDLIRNLLTRVAEEDLLEVPGLQQFRRDLLKRAKGYYEQFLVDSGDDDELMARAASAILDMVYIEGELGHFDNAAHEIERSLDLARTLDRRRPGTREHELLLVQILMTSGRVAHQRGGTDKAIELFDEGRLICSRVQRRNPDDAEAIAHLLGLDRGTALALKALGRDDEAAVVYRRLDDLWRERQHLLEGELRRTALDHVICSLADEVRFHVDRRDFDAARAASDLMDDIAKNLPNVDEMPISSRIDIALARAQINRSSLAAVDGDPEVEEQCLRECLRIAEEVLRKNPEHMNAMRTQAMAWNKLGLLMCAKPGRSADGLHALRQAEALTRVILKRDPDSYDVRVGLGSTIANIGSQYLDEQKATDALQCFSEAIQIMEACRDDAPHRTEHVQPLYNLTWFLGQAYGDTLDHANQEKWARRLAALRPDDGKTQRIAASLIAEAIVSVLQDRSLRGRARDARRTQLEVLGMDMLHAAAEHGCTDYEYLRTHEDMTPLRRLPGYADALQKIGANAAAARRTMPK